MEKEAQTISSIFDENLFNNINMNCSSDNKRHLQDIETFINNEEVEECQRKRFKTDNVEEENGQNGAISSGVTSLDIDRMGVCHSMNLFDHTKFTSNL